MTNFGENMITLNLTPLQYDIVKAAVAQYSNNLMQMIEPQKQTITVSTPVAVHHSMVGKSEAPWGVKKDGTPRARPGRKSTKTRKARA
jgi:hypothetical protein